MRSSSSTGAGQMHLFRLRNPAGPQPSPRAVSVRVSPTRRACYVTCISLGLITAAARSFGGGDSHGDDRGE